MTAHDEFEGHVDALRTRGVPESEVYVQVHKAHPTLYQRYLAERRAGIISTLERKAEARAEALRKALEQPAVSTETGPAQRIVDELCKMEIAAGHAPTVAAALPLVRAKYPTDVQWADEEAWQNAPGRS